MADADLLVVSGYFRNSAGTITAPAGWSQLGPLNTTNETFGLWSHPVPIAANESATTYTFSTSAGAGRLILICFRVTGANLTTPLDAQGALAVYTGTTSVVDPAVTAVQFGTLLLSMNITNTTTTTPALMTPPGTMTTVNQTSIVTATTTSAVEVAQQLLLTNGSTGTRTSTISPAAANSGGFMVTVAPYLRQQTITVRQAVKRAALF